MSSSSSSDYEYDDYCHYSNGYRYYDNNNRTPFYPTMGHPLIYYSEVPQPCLPRRQKSRDTCKGNPNCFVKAFKWYTKDHLPRRSNLQSSNDPKMTAFAAWLDTKYAEFMKNDQDDPNSYRVTMKQTSILTAEKNPPDLLYERCSTTERHCKRMKSPWRKKQSKSSKERRETIEKTMSFQYILQPKEAPLSHPNSVCFPSSVTESSDTQKKNATKSHSLTHTSTKSKDDTKALPKAQEIVFHKKPLKNEIKKESKSKDISCQCYNGVTGVHVATQYDFKDIETYSKINSPNQAGGQPKANIELKSIPRVAQSKAQSNYCQCPNNGVTKDARVQYETDDQLCGSNRKAGHSRSPLISPLIVQCTCESDLDELSTDSLKATNISSQTSDYPISIESPNCEYPLFMKIICADKLTEGSLK